MFIKDITPTDYSARGGRHFILKTDASAAVRIDVAAIRYNIYSEWLLFVGEVSCPLPRGLSEAGVKNAMRTHARVALERALAMLAD